jgi:hypothetical protein
MYGQFMAGEKSEDVLRVSRRLVSSGLYPMFAYTAGESHGQAWYVQMVQGQYFFALNFTLLSVAAILDPRTTAKYGRKTLKLCRTQLK